MPLFNLGSYQLQNTTLILHNFDRCQSCEVSKMQIAKIQSFKSCKDAKCQSSKVAKCQNCEVLKVPKYQIEIAKCPSCKEV